MPYKIAICDDEPVILNQVSDNLKQFQRETGRKFTVSFFSSAEDLIKQMDRDTDILLLDIGMAPMSGMEAARILRAEGLDVSIFFITSLTEYALEGYDVHAFAFLPKPISYETLKRHMNTLLSRMDRSFQENRTLIINTGASSELIDCTKLLYIEVYHHDTSFVFSDKKSSFRIPLASIEQKVLPMGFFRCHKSYLVNLKKIARIDFSHVTMSNGEVIPLSKYRRKEFQAAYSKFIGGQF